ncbi:MAG: S8 family serine peptidase [Gemmataceae bacterium]
MNNTLRSLGAVIILLLGLAGSSSLLGDSLSLHRLGKTRAGQSNQTTHPRSPNIPLFPQRAQSDPVESRQVGGTLLVPPWAPRAAKHTATPNVPTPLSLPNHFPIPRTAPFYRTPSIRTSGKSEAPGPKIKVAILDSGFRGYRNLLGTALPQKVMTRSFRQDKDLEARQSQHGLLCAEIVHAIAPNAEVLLANWQPDDPDSFLEALKWARREGARILSCSLIMPSWSDGEGGGRVNQTIAKIVGTGQRTQDLLFFVSAGNTAQRHWSGKFHSDGKDYHQWTHADTTNAIVPWGPHRVAVELYGKSVAGYDLEVIDSRQGRQVGQTVLRKFRQPDQESSCLLLSFFPKHQATRYQLRLRWRGPSAPPKDAFHLVVLGGNLEITKANGSIPCPADCPVAIAVGAVDRREVRCEYSSCGPNGNARKPDFVAIVPFPSLIRKRPFNGTSAAAPQAAGTAAVLWSRNPSWTADQVKKQLRKSAKDLGLPGHDWETGYGLVCVPNRRVHDKDH